MDLKTGLAVILLTCNFIIKSEAQTLYDILGQNPQLSEFRNAVDRSGAVLGALKDPEMACTVFVPTNEAFDRWRADYGGQVLTTDLLQMHISSRVADMNHLIEVSTKSAPQDRKLQSWAAASPLWLRLFRENPLRPKQIMFVNNAAIIANAARTASGKQYLFIIDNVLSPIGVYEPAYEFLRSPQDTSLNSYNFDKFRDYLDRFDSTEEFRDRENVYTFFVIDTPSLHNTPDEAINRNVLRAHIVKGEPLFLRTMNESRFGSSYFTERGLDAMDGYPALVNDNTAFRVMIDYSNSSGEPMIFSNLIRGEDANMKIGRVYSSIAVANIPVANGVVHILSSPLVLVPRSIEEYLENRKALSSLESYVARDEAIQSRLSDEGVTLFAPLNTAFDVLPLDKHAELNRRYSDILGLHVLRERLTTDAISNSTVKTLPDGTQLMFKAFGSENNRTFFVIANDVMARFVESDIATKNGVVHVIDRILGLPYLSVIEKLRNETDLGETFRALRASQMAYRLYQAPGNFTIFAPTNKAWSSMEHGVRNALLTNPYALDRVLARHIIPGFKLTSDRIPKNKEQFFSMNGELALQKSFQGDGSGTVSWNKVSAQLERPDVLGGNGVIHAIDRVLYDISDMNAACTAHISFLSAFLAFVVLSIIMR